jgi:hypothetical protein
MKLDMTQIAHFILYALKQDVTALNDKKLSVLLFLIDYHHLKNCQSKIFNDEYVKKNRHPEPAILAELFDIIANEEDLDETDERLYLIQELLDFLDIEVIPNKKFIELKFLKMEEEFDESIFSKEELKTIKKIVEKYQNTTARNLANDTFKLEEVRQTALGEVII